MPTEPYPPEANLPRAPEPPRRPGRARLILAGLIVGFGAVVFAATVSAGRTDSALFFVGLPVLLAAALTMSRGRTRHGQVFRITTIVLLLTAVALHEGAICVLLAAPLVYLLAHGVSALIGWAARGRRSLALVPLPLLLLGAVEGSSQQLRVHPDQTVEVDRVLALTPEQVLARVATGPRPVPVDSLALRLLAVPMPEGVHGGGVAVGDQWRFDYPGSSHGPGGRIVTRVHHSSAGRLCFQIIEDSAITARWFQWRDACLSWHPIDQRHTGVRLTLSTRRGLDPSWYFGPVQDRLLHQGGQHLLDMLALS